MGGSMEIIRSRSKEGRDWDLDFETLDFDKYDE
jgi:hypothetical protein